MQTIFSALTYDGSLLDSGLNAVVLLVVVAALATQRRSPWWVTLLVLVAMQVAMWFALGVVGFSIVWAGLSGVALVGFLRQGRRAGRRWPLAVAVLVAIAAIVYYAFALPLISTIAHVLASAVGAGIHVLALRVVRVHPATANR